ncbi:unnamed protein product [Prunus armeniaca]|uniref:Uncharacterized protein n=1 Tax=Prunus armeniaca TaxID=36596 RepID=A0A6J5XSY1_PRUAR|nr:unnamed protein product [Prunus armeniaca]
MCRVRAFALSRVLAPPPSIMLMFVWFLCLFWCFVRFDLGCDDLVAGFFFLLFPSTCPGDVISGGGGDDSIGFWSEFVSFHGLGMGLCGLNAF